MNWPQKRHRQHEAGGGNRNRLGGRWHSTTGGVDLVLSRLEGVKRTTAGWVAKCPAHTDRSPSLAMKEATDGTVLIHCYAGCDALAIVQAVGLSLADLFQNRLKPRTPEESRVARRAALHADWNAALGVLCREAIVVQCAAAYPQRGGALADDDHHRLDVAVERIMAAREVLSGR